MDKPDVESIEGIPPTIAIDQSRPVRTSRSTVGTMTELHDHFKLLFSKIGVLHCRGCERLVERDSAQSVYAKFDGITEGTAAVLAFPLPPSSVAWEDVRNGLRQAGFQRLLWIKPFANSMTWSRRPQAMPLCRSSSIALPFGPQNKKRITDSLEQAFHYGKGRLNLTSLRKNGAPSRSAIICIARTAIFPSAIRRRICFLSTVLWVPVKCAVALAGSSTSIWIW